MKRCKQCSFKNTCDRSAPWERAKTFYRRSIMLERRKRNADEQERKLAETGEPVPRFYGDYVFSPWRNAFNGKKGWWLSKKGCTVALYCFTAETGKEADAMLANGGGRAYIEMYETKTGAGGLVE